MRAPQLPLPEAAGHTDDSGPGLLHMIGSNCDSPLQAAPPLAGNAGWQCLRRACRQQVEGSCLVMSKAKGHFIASTINHKLGALKMFHIVFRMSCDCCTHC
jgi:hypothetical protein